MYGLDLIASVQGTTPTYYLTDGLGSTRQLTDGAGSVTGTYSYDAFGTVRTHTGASTQWSYTGEQNDPTGLQYLRARYYDPAIGRFLTQDPIGSLNPYAYVLNNPLRWLDPWGLRNVEGKAFATPTPTPVGAITVCGPAIHEECFNRKYVVPPSGSWQWDVLGDVRGIARRVVWDYSSWHLTYLAAREVVGFATSRSPACYVTGAIEVGAVGAMTFAPETAPVTYPISVGFAEPAVTSCFAQ